MKTIRMKLKNGEFFDVSLQPGDVMIDCGANVGDITAPFAALGAVVLAYEPNDYAFAKLAERFKHTKNVRCIKAAVSTRDGKEKLFLHEHSNQDPLKYSTGSSLLGDKQNVNPGEFIEVDVVDLAKIVKRFKEDYQKNIHILKIDIEGAECELLEKFMDEGLLSDIPYVFVETHEKKIPSLKERTNRVIERAKELQLNNVNFNWI